MIAGIDKRISIRSAPFIASVYFLLLGLTNFAATYIYAEIKPLDTIIAVVCALPFLVRHYIFRMAFGIIAALLSIYGTLAGLAFCMNPQVQTSSISFLMGFLLTGSVFVSSLVLIFACKLKSGTYSF